MRLPLIPPADLTPKQKPLYDEMRKGIASNFNAFKVEREDGALMGPWNPWLHEPCRRADWCSAPCKRSPVAAMARSTVPRPRLSPPESPPPPRPKFLCVP